MKTKTYPDIGFLRLRGVIGGKDNPGIIPMEPIVLVQGDRGREIFEAGEAGGENLGLVSRVYLEVDRGVEPTLISAILAPEWLHNAEGSDFLSATKNRKDTRKIILRF